MTDERYYSNIRKVLALTDLNEVNKILYNNTDAELLTIKENTVFDAKQGMISHIVYILGEKNPIQEARTVSSLLPPSSATIPGTSAIIKKEEPQAKDSVAERMTKLDFRTSKWGGEFVFANDVPEDIKKFLGGYGKQGYEFKGWVYTISSQGNLNRVQVK